MYKEAMPAAKAMQIEFHQRADLRVATAEGFWLARWMQGSLLSNLDACGISADKVLFNDLNATAWLVEVEK